jgi:putative FmdB family regulatory protein
MPTYEFLCQNCKEASAFICSITEYERKKKEGIKCSECGSLEVEQQISGFRVQTSKKS